MQARPRVPDASPTPGSPGRICDASVRLSTQLLALATTLHLWCHAQAALGLGSKAVSTRMPRQKKQRAYVEPQFWEWRIQHESFHHRDGRWRDVRALDYRRNRAGQRQTVSRELGALQVGQGRLGGLVQPYQEPCEREARDQHDQ